MGDEDTRPWVATTSRTLRRILLTLGGSCLALGVAVGLPAVVEHDELRSAWAEVRGTDVARSDRLYEASRRAHRKAGAGGLLGAVGALLLIAGWRSMEHRQASSARADLRVWVATAADGAAFLALLGLALLDDGESASLHALSAAAPALAFVPVAPLPWGRSLGLGLTRLRSSPGPRGILAAALIPVGLLAAPFGLALPGARALHLRLAGMHVVAGEADC